jgi:hypothetical protein
MRSDGDKTIVMEQMRGSGQSKIVGLLTEGLLILFALVAIGGAGVIISTLAADTEIITRAHSKIVSAASLVLVVVAALTITVGAVASALVEDWKAG